jgi:hypothetical protein
MTVVYCSYLGQDVEITAEREAHIALRHPDLLPAHHVLLIETISDPDTVRRSARFRQALLLSRWYKDLFDGKHVVAVIASGASPERHWRVTAYISRKLTGGEMEWRKG